MMYPSPISTRLQTTINLQEKPLFEDDAEITVELVNQKIAELSSVRGRRGAKRQKNIETLEMLSGICVSENLGRLFPINCFQLFS